MGKNEENQKMFGKTVGSKPNNGFQVVHQYKPLWSGNIETYIEIAVG